MNNIDRVFFTLCRTKLKAIDMRQQTELKTQRQIHRWAHEYRKWLRGECQEDRLISKWVQIAVSFQWAVVWWAERSRGEDRTLRAGPANYAEFRLWTLRTMKRTFDWPEIKLLCSCYFPFRMIQTLTCYLPKHKLPLPAKKFSVSITEGSIFGNGSILRILLPLLKKKKKA